MSRDKNTPFVMYAVISSEREDKPRMIVTDCIESRLARFFNSYGQFVGKHPLYFVIIPIIFSACLGIGILNLSKNNDMEYLYTPDDGPAKTERKIFKDTFGQNFSDFSPSRSLLFDGFARIIITTKDGSHNILEERIYSEIQKLDLLVKSIGYDDDAYSFYDVCARQNGNCVSSTLPKINISAMADTNLTYPMYQDQSLSFLLGGVNVNTSNRIIKNVRALQLSYQLKYGTTDEQRMSSEWLEAFQVNISQYVPDDSNLNIDYATSQSLPDELTRATTQIVTKFSITYAILINFSIFSCLMLDPVRSKPWLAFLGVLSVGLAIVSTIGLLSVIGVEFNDIVANMPFLALGVGVDDMFIMIAAWRRSDPHHTVPERMGHTLRDAALSITITSLTDGMAFAIGAITSFPVIRTFCIYTGVAILFDFIYQCTFFAGCMALFGQREGQNRHAWTCMKIKTKDTTEEVSGTLSSCQVLCCTGGYYDEEPESKREPGLMIFFREYFAPLLTKPIMKICVIFIYFGYIGLSVWGCWNLKEGLDLKNLAPDGSYIGYYHEVNDKYFNSQYGPPVMVAFTEPAEYWKKEVQDQIEHITQTFENDTYFTNDSTISWMRSFNDYLKVTNQQYLNSSEFMHLLKNSFLEHPRYSYFKTDLKFSETNSNVIVASRILVQSRGLSDGNEQKNMMLQARHIARSATLRVTTFHAVFIFLDQYAVILSNTLTNIGLAGGCMLVIAILLVPNLLCAFWIAITIISIDGGVIGTMALWGVSLDSVSMVNIILCIGFSVDFSAHIAYAFVTSKKRDKDSKMIDALGSLGMPITQSALSTILAIIILSTTNTYIFRTFFKTIFLVMILGAFHGLVVLPVLLSFFGPGKCAPESINATVSPPGSPNTSRTHSISNLSLGYQNKWVSTPDTPNTSQKHSLSNLPPDNPDKLEVTEPVTNQINSNLEEDTTHF